MTKTTAFDAFTGARRLFDFGPSFVERRQAMATLREPEPKADSWACAMPSDKPPEYYEYTWPNGELRPMTAPTPEPAAKEGEWLPWLGGDQPVADDVMVEIRFIDGTTDQNLASIWSWSWSVVTPLDPGWGDIVAYRLIPQGVQS